MKSHVLLGVLLVLTLGLTNSLAWGQDVHYQGTIPYTLQTAATATGSGTVANIGGLSSLSVTITGSGIYTITFEVTIDGTNWQAIQGRQSTTLGTLSSTATAPGTWSFTVGSYSQFRARISAHTSGTINVTGRGSQAVLSNWSTSGGGGSSGLTVGTTTITSGSNNAILYENGSGILGATSTFTFDGTHVSNTQGQTNSEAWGAGSTVSAASTVALGCNANAGTANSVVVGSGASTTAGTSNVVMGRNASSVSVYGGEVIIGDSAVGGNNAGSNGGENTVIGGAATAGGNGGTVLVGHGSVAYYGGNGVGVGSECQTGPNSVAVGYAAHAVSNNSIALGAWAQTPTANTLVAGWHTSTGNYITDAYIGSGPTDATPQNIIYHATGGSGTDVSGANLTVAGGTSTGAAADGAVHIQTSTPGTTGTTVQTLADRLVINSTGATFSVPVSAPNLPSGLTVGTTDRFRLTLTSNTPVPTSDVTGATSIYLTPYNGDLISLFYSEAWGSYTSTQVSASLSGLTSGNMYDVFAYWNGSAVALDIVAWTNSTTRATALTTQNGVLVLTGDATKRYVGSFYTSGTGQTSDSVAARFLWNYYNRVSRNSTSGIIIGASTSSTSWTNASSGAQIAFVVGVDEDAVRCDCYTQVHGIAGMRLGIGLDRTSDSGLVDDSLLNAAAVSIGNEVTIGCIYMNQVSPGFHTFYAFFAQYGGGSSIYDGAVMALTIRG